MRHSLYLVAVASIVFASHAVVAAPDVGAPAAESFDALAARALVVRDRPALGALFWASVARCDGTDGDMQRRQCERLREARRAQVGAAHYLVRPSQPGIELGVFDEARGIAPLLLRGCLACSRGIEGAEAEAELGRLVVAGAGRVEVRDGHLAGPPIAEEALRFPDQRAAERFRREQLPRLRAEFLVRIPGKVPRWQAGGAQGYRVEVLGYRIYDPCGGKVLLSHPASQGGPRDASACPAEAPAVLGAVEERGGPPDALSQAVVSEAMRPVRARAEECYRIYGIRGDALFQLSVSASGEVLRAEQLGDFTDTPTGECIQEAVRDVSFPSTRAPRTQIEYPLTVP